MEKGKRIRQALKELRKRIAEANEIPFEIEECTHIGDCPGTCPKWSAVDSNSLICGEPALLKPATLRCVYGGTISIVSPGQNKEIKR